MVSIWSRYVLTWYGFDIPKAHRPIEEICWKEARRQTKAQKQARIGTNIWASINRGPQNRPKYIMVLILGPYSRAKMGPLIFGNSQIFSKGPNA